MESWVILQKNTKAFPAQEKPPCCPSESEVLNDDMLREDAVQAGVI
jgi:hypothetical protein